MTQKQLATVLTKIIGLLETANSLPSLFYWMVNFLSKINSGELRRYPGGANPMESGVFPFYPLGSLVIGMVLILNAKRIAEWLCKGEVE